jgi:hypothetical protein
MNRLSNLYRDLSCGAGAVLITLILSAAFVEATAVPPGTHTHASRVLALQSSHGWFGQPEPAVLVD